MSQKWEYPVRAGLIPVLRRVTTWEEWETGRAARRALAVRITGGKILRRVSGNPRKDLHRGDEKLSDFGRNGGEVAVAKISERLQRESGIKVGAKQRDGAA